ncbi:aryl-sulfate sulfotransferase N-terminal domain-containing protein [Desulfosporosinus nitroreducens]|nr:aryl-sulfate sulfotransferase N-terminal domain-containing protein [Desulfosporosinus nitroreducens]
MFKTEQESQVTVTVKGKEAAGDISHTFPKNKVHQIPVYGLYGDYHNIVILRLENSEEKVIEIRTEPYSQEESYERLL